MYPDVAPRPPVSTLGSVRSHQCTLVPSPRPIVPLEAMNCSPLLRWYSMSDLAPRTVRNWPFLSAADFGQSARLSGSS
jgi:hypothetical protein